jgi:hypothetical protein
VFAVLTFLIAASLASVSAHVIKGLFHPMGATAFVSSASAGAEVPIAISLG